MMKRFKKNIKAELYRTFFFCFVLLLIGIFIKPSEAMAAARKDSMSAYLFAYFTGNGGGEESIHFAISKDGLHYKALNQNRPIIDSRKISKTGGVRDPHIYRSLDGKMYYMVATDMHVATNGWGPNYGMVLMKSNDLINWRSTSINIPEEFPDLNKGTAKINRVWAPQTIYDKKKKKYMIYWAMRFGNDKDKIYYAYVNSDFTKLETTPQQLFYSPENAACIDADIVEKDGEYHLFFKTEDKKPGIKTAISKELTKGYKMVTNDYLEATNQPVEGSCTFKLNGTNEWILMYDVYQNGTYQFTKSKDLIHFEPIKDFSMNFHPRHGTVLSITKSEAIRLVSKWLPEELPLFSGTNDNSVTGQTISKKEGSYTITTKGQQNNPVIKGLYADPEILFSHKTNKFYIYPTTDGFADWSGYYFKAFSSNDLVNWKDEGIILDLKKDVKWGHSNAWAPCIIERKIKGKYKYFYYYCDNKQIGVAVSDSPTGPFMDSGKPLINKYPKGVNGGQQIDPDVFQDPKTGKYYLYWGNAYLAGAELNDDMISIKENTIKVLTPPAYTEGTYVFYRKGKYYFTWSQGDTRSPDYKVRYGISDGPLNRIHTETDNIILEKDASQGIYGTGHNSVIQIPKKDQWYIVYHRFKYPDGIKMGTRAGFNREVCIDKMEFTEDGKIKKVVPSLSGIQPIRLH